MRWIEVGVDKRIFFAFPVPFIRGVTVCAGISPSFSMIKVIWQCSPASKHWFPFWSFNIISRIAKEELGCLSIRDICLLLLYAEEAAAPAASPATLPNIDPQKEPLCPSIRSPKAAPTDPPIIAPLWVATEVRV